MCVSVCCEVRGEVKMWQEVVKGFLSRKSIAPTQKKNDLNARSDFQLEESDILCPELLKLTPQSWRPPLCHVAMLRMVNNSFY